MKKVIATKDFLIMELIVEKSLITLNDKAQKEKGHLVVVDIGKDVKEVKVGDTVIVMGGQIAEMKDPNDYDKKIYFAKEEYVSLIIREEVK